VLALISGALLRRAEKASKPAQKVRTVGPDGDSSNLAMLNISFSSPYGNFTNALQAGPD